MDKKVYSNNKGISVVWEPEKCKHAGICVKLLPKVYNVQNHPWITPENANMNDLKNQIDKCPSGALSYIIPKV